MVFCRRGDGFLFRYDDLSGFVIGDGDFDIDFDVRFLFFHSDCKLNCYAAKINNKFVI